MPRTRAIIANPERKALKIPPSPSTSRRRFLKTAAAAGMAGVLPEIVPSSAMGRAGSVAPSERVVLACIGVGGMGQGDMHNFMACPEVQVVAVCDVKRAMREAAQQAVNAHYAAKVCETYSDFRDLVARDDIDAISIASTDSWHVLHALAAVRAGKHVYLEKPMGVSIEEIKALRQAVRQRARAFQFGTQQRSSQNFRVACELALNGRIGRIHTIKVGVHAGAGERSGLGTYTPEPVPDGFDYDFWLGPAPLAPYHPKRVVNPHWFHISDYSLGYVSGWGIHHIDIAQWGNGTERTGPVEVWGTAEFPRDDALCDNPVSWDLSYTYSNGTLLSFTGSGPNFPGNRHGITFEGTDGWIWVDRGGLEAQPTSILQEKIGPDEIHLPVSDFHQQNLVDAIRFGRDTICNIEVAVRSDTICQLGWIAFQTGRKLRWDPDKEEILNDPGATRLMSRAMREPWHL